MTKPNDQRSVRGRAAIAHRLGRSERTVSRWVARGILPVRPGLFPNDALEVRSADLARLTRDDED